MSRLLYGLEFDWAPIHIRMTEAMIGIEKVAYGGWENVYRLSNDRVEALVTADVGPRVIRFGFVGQANEFHEVAEHLGKYGGDAWRSYGGHRFWHSPEHPQRTYV